MSALLSVRQVALPGRLQPSDLDIQAGALVCLVGPNGSGKTSLLHGLARIGEARGSVRIAGQDPDRLSPAERKRLLAYLPASRDVAWPLAARDVIALGFPVGDPPEGVEEIADALALEPLLDRRIDRLSTGERSRVLIARALAPRPLLVLLDEPAANLDPKWQLKLMDLLQGLTKSGQTVVAAMHDLDLASRYADRLILMEKGRIAVDGDPAILISGPEIPRIFGVARGETGWQLAAGD